LTLPGSATLPFIFAWPLYLKTITMSQEFTFDQLPQAVNQLHKKLENIERLLQSFQLSQSAELQEHLLTVQEAAEFLNLTVPTIYSKVSRRELPFMKRQKRLYFSNKELLAYLKEGSRKTYTQITSESDNYINSK
jgi:excisionase family DNA binding protein